MLPVPQKGKRKKKSGFPQNVRGLLMLREDAIEPWMVSLSGVPLVVVGTAAYHTAAAV